MTTLTVPEKEMWVNLSPYEKNRIIANGLGDTQMGIDMLAQDYILKQLTASLMYPEDRIGNEFWKRVYSKAQEKYGTSEIPMNTFNKIWIVPEKASVYVNGNSVFIADSQLKVMLEEDYLALESNIGNTEHGVGELPEDEVFEISGVTSEIVRDILIPEIEREVNEGKNFSKLRQIFHSMILATWYKQNLKESVLGYIYVDKNKINGVDIEDKKSKQKVYAQYIKVFERGVYDYIKEDYDVVTQEIIARKYFSGGENFAQLSDKVSGVERQAVLERDGANYVIAKGAVNPMSYSGSSLVTRRDFLKMLGIATVVTLLPGLSMAENEPTTIDILIALGEDTNIGSDPRVIRKLSGYLFDPNQSEYLRKVAFSIIDALLTQTSVGPYWSSKAKGPPDTMIFFHETDLFDEVALLISDVYGQILISEDSFFETFKRTIGLRTAYLINILHNQPDEIRFASLKDYSATQLYELIIYGADELWTSSYNGIFNRFIARLEAEGLRFDEFIKQRKMNSARTFFKLVAIYNRLDDLFVRMPEKAIA